MMKGRVKQKKLCLAPQVHQMIGDITQITDFSSVKEFMGIMEKKVERGQRKIGKRDNQPKGKGCQKTQCGLRSNGGNVELNKQKPLNREQGGCLGKWKNPKTIFNNKMHTKTKKRLKKKQQKKQERKERLL